MARQRRPEVGLGIMLLLHRLFSFGFGNILPVTLMAIVGQVLLYMGIIHPPWDKNDVCLSGHSILYLKDYKRLVLSAIEHSNDLHLYHNMASLLLKGQSLERRYGSKRFFILVAVLTLSSSLTYVLLVKTAANYLDDYSYMKQCAIGFSGVLFAMKVLTTHYDTGSVRYIHGVTVPSKYAVWVELVVIHILVPRASFVGHLAGILAGLAYTYGPLKVVVNLLSDGIPAGPRARYTFAHGNTRSETSYTHSQNTTYRGPTVNTRSSRSNEQDDHENNAYGWNVPPNDWEGEPTSSSRFRSTAQTESTVPNNVDLDELRQQRLRRFNL